MSISWELVQGGSLAQQSSLQLGMTHSQCAGENVEHLELSAPAGGTVNPHSHFKDCLAESTKAERTDPETPLLSLYPTEITSYVSPKDMYKKVQSSTIHIVKTGNNPNVY